MSDAQFPELHRQMEQVRQFAQAWGDSINTKMRALREANPQLFAANAEPEESAPMTLTEFLLARIAEDEGDAWAWGYHGLLCGHLQDWPCDCGHPERALAECEAKRRIVAMFLEHASAGDKERATALIDVVDELAAVYADHPDYREEWKP